MDSLAIIPAEAMAVDVRVCGGGVWPRRSWARRAHRQVTAHDLGGSCDTKTLDSMARNEEDVGEELMALLVCNANALTHSPHITQ